MRIEIILKSFFYARVMFYLSEMETISMYIKNGLGVVDSIIFTNKCTCYENRCYKIFQ